jgi:hypothetical protein
MGFITKEDGTIIARQGDGGQVFIDGIDTAKNYKIYFGVKDKKRNAIGREVYVYSNQSSEVVIVIPPSVTNSWVVPKNEDYVEYYYGIKVCDEETSMEDTLILAGCEFDTENILIVYPKKVEGTLNNVEEEALNG